jgi:hypothetical protein
MRANDTSLSIEDRKILKNLVTRNGIYEVLNELSNIGNPNISREELTSITYAGLARKMGGTGVFKLGGVESIKVKASVLNALTNEYPDMFNLEETQNDSPCMGEFLTQAEPDDILLTYVVDDNRSDRRVSVEGIITKSKDVAFELLTHRPDEYTEEAGEYRLWWD